MFYTVFIISFAVFGARILPIFSKFLQGRFRIFVKISFRYNQKVPFYRILPKQDFYMEYKILYKHL